MRGSPRGARKALDRLGAQGKAESTTTASDDPGKKKTGIRCCGACQLAFVAVVDVAECRGAAGYGGGARGERSPR